MKLYTDEQYQKLIENGKNPDQDHAPVIRLHILFTGCQWLISELDPEYPQLGFGLCDLGMGQPELGYVDIEEIKAVKTVPFPVMGDMFFQPEYPMSTYAEAARMCQSITLDEDHLKQGYLAVQERRKKSQKPE
jgi:hypothetical protein